MSCGNLVLPPRPLEPIQRDGHARSQRDEDRAAVSRTTERGFTCLKYMRPLLPTFATVKCLPSRPADPPSGVMSNFSVPSASDFLARLAGAFSSCDFRSVTGTKGFAAGAATRLLLFHLPGPVSLPNIRGLASLNLASRTLPPTPATPVAAADAAAPPAPPIPAPPLGDSGFFWDASRWGCRMLRPGGSGEDDGMGSPMSMAAGAT
jgi:hypothetical protein